MVILVPIDEKVSILCKYVFSIKVFQDRIQDGCQLSYKTLYYEISQGFSCLSFYFKFLIHTISTLTFRTIAQVSLPYQDVVIIIFKMAFKKAAMISCAKRI